MAAASVTIVNGDTIDVEVLQLTLKEIAGDNEKVSGTLSFVLKTGSLKLRDALLANGDFTTGLIELELNKPISRIGSKGYMLGQSSELSLNLNLNIEGNKRDLFEI